MQLMSKYNKGIRHLLCEIDIFSKNAWVVPSKDEKGITIFNTFQSILDSSKCKPIKIRVERFVRNLKNRIYKHMAAV